VEECWMEGEALRKEGRMQGHRDALLWHDAHDGAQWADASQRLSRLEGRLTEVSHHP